MKYDEVIDRIKSGSFAGEHGFDLQLLVNLIGTLGEMLRNGYTIMQAQEPVEPKMIEFVDKGLTWEKYEVPTCGECGTLLGDALFCPQCGRKVKWK